MDLDAIQDEIRRLDECIEKVREDFSPKFDALHEQFAPWLYKSRYPADVRARERHRYRVAYEDLCGSMMRAIQVYSYPQMALHVQVMEWVRMNAIREVAA